MGTGSGPAGRAARRQAFDDADALKLFFFFIIRLNYRKFKMIFKRGTVEQATDSCEGHSQLSAF